MTLKLGLHKLLCMQRGGSQKKLNEWKHLREEEGEHLKRPRAGEAGAGLPAKRGEGLKAGMAVSSFHCSRWSGTLMTQK